MTAKALTLKHFYPHLTNQTGSVAIELELESKKEVYPEAVGWKTDRDGSLRYYGIEMKSAAPVKEASLRAHLDNLLLGIKNYDWILPSPRTSTHVHVNTMGLTPIQIYTAACAYWFLEPYFFSLCDDSRKGNLFCLRLQDARGMVSLIEDDIENTCLNKVVPFRTFNNDAHRYSSINFASLYKFGSLEFRGLHGTIDMDLIERWTKLCLNTVYRSSRFSDPQAFLDYTLDKGYKQVQEDLLGSSLASDIKINDDLFDLQMERLVDIAGVWDWRDYNKVLESIQPSKKDKKAELNRQLGEDLNRQLDEEARRIRELTNAALRRNTLTPRAGIDLPVAGQRAEVNIIDDEDL